MSFMSIDAQGRLPDLANLVSERTRVCELVNVRVKDD